jgi:hypothetical protein
MNSANRLKRLRDLADQLQRLPATAERDRMLRDVRARIVDVDTGVAPSALQPVEPDPRPAPRPRSRTTRPPVAARPAEEVAADASYPAAGDRLAIAADELLSLDDSSFSPIEPRADLAAAPWRAGLRG